MIPGRFTIGVDLGRTNIRTALVKDGKVFRTARQRTKSSESWKVVANQIVESVNNLTGGEEPLGIGIGVAGQCSFKGVVRRGPNFWWPEAPFRQFIQDETGIPTLVGNDTRAATFGEWQYGAGKGCDDLVCLFVGTGLGGGVVSGGRLLTGCSNTAGELGHIIVKMDGPPCGCGNKGCLESIVSGWGIANRAKEEAARDPRNADLLIQLAHGDPDGITSEIVATGSFGGDPLSRLIIEEAAEAFTAGIISFVHAFNPRRVIIGGGVATGIPDLLDRPREVVKSRAMGCTCEQLEIVPSALGDDAGAVGAAALLVRSLKEHKREWA